jgi:hypothetical protein
MAGNRDQKQLQDWTERLREFRSGEQTVRAYCERHDISQARFFYWQRKLTSPAAKPRQAKHREVAARGSVASTGTFVPVMVKSTERTQPCLSIQLSTGVLIRVPMEVGSFGLEVV